MILSGDKCVASYDPNTGARHWLIDGPTGTIRRLAGPQREDGAGVCHGRFPDHHLLAIRPDGAGNVTQTHIVWRTNKGVAYVPRRSSKATIS